MIYVLLEHPLMAVATIVLAIVLVLAFVLYDKLYPSNRRDQKGDNDPTLEDAQRLLDQLPPEAQRKAVNLINWLANRHRKGNK